MIALYERMIEQIALWIASGVVILAPAWGPLPNPDTPTPEPPPVTFSIEAEGQLSEASVHAIALEVSGSAVWADRFVDVSWCESRWQPWVTGDAGEAGLAQIHPVHEEWIRKELGIAWGDLYDPHVNVLVAFALWEKAGSSWTPWSCRRRRRRKE